MIVRVVLLFLCAGNFARGERCESDIVFMIDASSSISKTDFPKEIEFVNKLIDEFAIAPEEAQVAALKFSIGVKQIFKFDPSMTSEDLKAKISAIPFDSGDTTNTHLALQEMRRMFSPTSGHRPGVPKIGILLTDGNPTDPYKTKNESVYAKNENIIIIAIGVGKKISRANFEEIVTLPAKEHVFMSSNFDVLKSAGFVESIRKEACATTPTPRPRATTTTTTTTFATTALEEIQKDETLKNCPKDTQSQILFGLFSVGGHDRVTVIEFIVQVWKFYFEAKADLEIGLIESCVNTNLDLREYTSLEIFKKALQTTTDRNIASFLKTIFSTLTSSGDESRVQKQKTAILIVSGDVDVNKDVIMRAERFKPSSRIIVIAVGCNSESQLKQIASFEKTGLRHKTHFFSVSEISQLPYLLQLIIDLLCNKMERHNPTAPAS